MDPEETQIARTESAFRSVNEGIAETAQLFGSDEAEFICECADAECQHRVPAAVDEYEEVRSDGTQFLVVEGHEKPKYERVVKRRRGYAVVRKLGRRLAAAVRARDPRTDTA
jgi:hypothetical protein